MTKGTKLIVNDQGVTQNLVLLRTFRPYSKVLGLFNKQDSFSTFHNFRTSTNKMWTVIDTAEKDTMAQGRPQEANAV